MSQHNMSQINKWASKSFSSKLKKFLLFASIEGTYYPGIRMNPQIYLGKNLATLRILLNDVELSTVFKYIEWIQLNQLDVHEEIIPLVLSECCKVAEWKTQSLQFALKSIKNGRQFLLFCKFSFEILPSIGKSKQVLDFIKEWYSIHHYLEVTEMVQNPSFMYGWKHEHAMKLAQVHSNEPARAAVYAYAIEGLDKMNKKFMHLVDAEEIVSHFNRVVKFQEIVDPQIAAVEMARYHCTMNNVNPILRDSKQVWLEAIPKMNLIELMDRFKTFGPKGLLRCPKLNSWDPYFITKLCDRFESSGAILESNIHPARSFLEHQRVQYEAIIKHQYAMKHSNTIFTPVRPNQKILCALESQMKKAFNNIKPVGIDISIVIDTTDLIGSCGGVKAYVRAHNAAALISLCLKKSGDQVDILTFDGDKEIDLSSENTVFTMAQAIKNINNASQLLCIKKHLEKTSNKDLIVVIGSSINHDIYMHSVNSHEHNQRQTKFVFCSLKRTIKHLKRIYHERLLVTSGFDDKLVSIITGFGMKSKF